MNSLRGRFRQALAWITLLAIVIASFLPLSLFYRQAIIGIVLIWFQVSLMIGIIH
jgi:hypothetical protein